MEWTYGVCGIEGSIFSEGCLVQGEKYGWGDGLIDKVLRKVDKHKRKYTTRMLVSTIPRIGLKRVQDDDGNKRKSTHYGKIRPRERRRSWKNLVFQVVVVTIGPDDLRLAVDWLRESASSP